VEGSHTEIGDCNSGFGRQSTVDGPTDDHLFLNKRVKSFLLGKHKKRVMLARSTATMFANRAPLGHIRRGGSRSTVGAVPTSESVGAPATTTATAVNPMAVVTAIMRTVRHTQTTTIRTPTQITTITPRIATTTTATAIGSKRARYPHRNPVRRSVGTTGSPANVNQGDSISATLVNDVSVNGRVIAPAGTPIQAKVVSAQGHHLMFAWIP
jgi:hypothetical protein